MPSFRALCVGVLVVALGSVAAGAPRTLLLVDDHDVLYRSGTKRVLHQTQRRADPIVAQDKPWEITVAYNSVYRNPETGRYQMWYQVLASRSPERAGVAYAESDDGVHWRKPNLGLYSFQGQDTNLVLALSDGHYGASVLVDTRETDPARRYKMVCFRAAMINGQRIMGLAEAFSPDGIHWTVLPQFPLIPGNYGRPADPPLSSDPHTDGNALMSVSDVIDLMYDTPRGLYVIYTKTWLDAPDGKTFWKRAIARSESRDFTHWSKPTLVIQPDEFDGTGVEYRPPTTKVHPTRRGVQLHGGPVFLHEGVYFSLLQKMDGEITGQMPIELAVSRDGLNWQRPFRAVNFIDVDNDREKFDAGCIWTNATPVVLDDEIRFYYGAYSGLWNGDMFRAPTGIGLATIPRDRFAGVRPIGQTGQVTLKPMDLTGVQAMTVNSTGTVRVEVLTEAGYRVPGFTKDDAKPIVGDSLRHAVEWKDRRLQDLPPGSYLLRVHLDQAELFAITLR